MAPKKSTKSRSADAEAGDSGSTAPSDTAFEYLLTTKKGTLRELEDNEEWDDIEPDESGPDDESAGNGGDTTKTASKKKSKAKAKAK